MCSSSEPQPTSQNVTQTTIPEYAKPYAEKMLGKTEALTNAPYQPYQGERIAGFTPMQQQAQQAAKDVATGAAYELGGQAIGAGAGAIAKKILEWKGAYGKDFLNHIATIVNDFAKTTVFSP